MRKNTVIACAVLCATAVYGVSASAAEFQRRYIRIVGSNAVAPYAKAVGERYAKAKKAQVPLLEATSTGGGIKLFCEGASDATPDIAVSSRAMKPKEREECQANGVGDILEVKIGYDGLVLAQGKKAPPLDLGRKEARLALAKWVAGPDGQLAPNPHKTWKDISPAFPDQPLAVQGPAPTSGAYDALVDMVSESECQGRPWVAAGQAEPTADALRKCRALRDDGVYVEGREGDESQVFLLASAPAKVAVLDYKLLADHADQLRAIPIDGVEPTAESIGSRRYAGTRPLFLYVKGAHLGLTPGLKDYVAEFASEKTWGEQGYLQKLGLVVMPPAERASYVDAVKAAGITPSSAAAPAAGKSGSKAGKAVKVTKESHHHGKAEH